MHDDWFDLIPYYVNRTLPDGERMAFERHITTCESCRRALDDWNQVAGAVYNEVDRWAQQKPALSPQIRASLGLSSNGHNHYHAAFAPGETFSVQAIRRARRTGIRSRLPLTMVAAAVMVLMFGVVVLVIASRSGDNSPTVLSGVDVTETPVRTPHPSTLGAVTATPRPTSAEAARPSPTPGDLGIIALLQTATPTPRPSVTMLPTRTPRPPDSPTPTLYWPGTPTAAYQYGIGSGYVMLTTTQVGAISAGTRVRISQAWYDGSGWIYTVVAEDEQTTADAREWQLAYAPDVTPGPIPPAAYQGAIGMGYLMVTTEWVGSFPAGTRVRISQARFDGYRWVYTIAAQDEQNYADAYEWQIAYAPDVTPGPTPTAVYGSSIGSGYLRTTEQVGPIPAGARVRIGSAWFDGFDWVYQIVAEDGFTTAEARTAQLTYDTEPIYTPTPTPACPYSTTLTGVCPVWQQSMQTAYQLFENGFMVWRGDTREIYVFYQSGWSVTYPDTWVEGETYGSGETPPAGRLAPERGFGKVWATQPGVRDSLGWAITAENGYTALWEVHEGWVDTYFVLPDSQIVHRTSGGGWSFY